MAVAVDTAGNLYFSGYSNYRIRRVDPNGVITTAVGNGVQGSGGDGGLPTLASLRAPMGMAFDSLKRLIFADTYNQRIRKLFCN